MQNNMQSYAQENGYLTLKLNQCLKTLTINHEYYIPILSKQVKEHKKNTLHDLLALILKVPGPKSVENEFSLNWQIWPPFQAKYHPR